MRFVGFDGESLYKNGAKWKDAGPDIHDADIDKVTINTFM